METQDKTTKNTTITLILIIICIACVMWFTIPSIITQPTELTREYTTTYTSITPEEAKNLIDNKEQIVIIADIRGCKCNYDEGHIPGAIWRINPKSFYNTANDILIYCNDGNNSKEFCQDLTGHTYGSIYHLNGGINAWENKGYEIIK